MFKQFTMTSSVLALAIASSAAMATPQTHDVQVFADIPSSDFYVLPVDHGTVTMPQQLIWNDAAQKLDSTTLNFKARSSAVGASGNPGITATLQDPVGMTSGSESIDLNISFNGEALIKGTAVPVVDADAAMIEIIAPMQITPVEPAGGYKEGNYTGVVRVTFDAS